MTERGCSALTGETKHLQGAPLGHKGLHPHSLRPKLPVVVETMTMLAPEKQTPLVVGVDMAMPALNQAALSPACADPRNLHLKRVVQVAARGRTPPPHPSVLGNASGVVHFVSQVCSNADAATPPHKRVSCMHHMSQHDNG